MRVLMSYKSGSIDSALQNLKSAQIDTLMKYIYKGFENPEDESSKLLLVWHEKVLWFYFTLST